MAYESTSVSIESSQGSLRKLLSKNGANGFGFRESKINHPDLGETWVVGIEFTFDGSLVRMVVPCKPPDPKAIQAKARRARTKTADEIEYEMMDQEMRRIWRVLFYNTKARMEAVEEQVETFEQAFLAHLVDPATNQTLWQRMEPLMDTGAFKIGGSGLKGLGAGE